MGISEYMQCGICGYLWVSLSICTVLSVGICEYMHCVICGCKHCVIYRYLLVYAVCFLWVSVSICSVLSMVSL